MNCCDQRFSAGIRVLLVDMYQVHPLGWTLLKVLFGTHLSIWMSCPRPGLSSDLVCAQVSKCFLRKRWKWNISFWDIGPAHPTIPLSLEASGCTTVVGTNGIREYMKRLAKWEGSRDKFRSLLLLQKAQRTGTWWKRGGHYSVLKIFISKLMAPPEMWHVLRTILWPVFYVLWGDLTFGGPGFVLLCCLTWVRLWTRWPKMFIICIFSPSLPALLSSFPPLLWTLKQMPIEYLHASLNLDVPELRREYMARCCLTTFSLGNYELFGQGFMAGCCIHWGSASPK
jgi:hypothetical protein